METRLADIFWYMENIFKNKGRCDVYVSETCNGS